MENIINGIVADESLRNIICEREDCFLSDEGDLCVFSPDGDFSDVIDVVKSSELAFDGRFFGLEPNIKTVSKQDVHDIVLHLKSNSHNDNDLDKKGAANTEAKQRLQRLLELALLKKVSDIHIRLNKERNITQISGRKHGELIELMSDQELDYGETICFYASTVLGGEQSFTIDSQADCTFLIDTTVSEVDSGGTTRKYSKNTKWRMSQIKIDDGSKITIRALEMGTAKLPNLNKLGLTNGQVDAFVSVVNGAQGAILMSGPTGSGKTTTINCALETIKSTKVIHSLEDPVEFNRQGRNHFATPVNEDFTDPKTKTKTRTFEYYGKVLLRHDTDVLYFGEVRDKAAAAQFMRLATTGQVMVGTIHCNSSISIITTVAEQLGVPITQLAAPGILKALAHQRLVRTLCPDCKIPHKDAIKISEEYGDNELKNTIDQVEKLAKQEKKTTDNVFYKNKHSDCKTCEGRGENGRTALFEIIMIDDIARKYIRELKLSEWSEHLKSLNWPSIADHGKAKIFKGILDYSSVIDQVDDLVQEDVGDIYNSMHEEC